MKKRMKRLCCISACLCFCASVLCTGCTAAFYSEEAHIRRVTERAEARFLGEGSAYTGLEVFPIYNEYEEFHYLLIELEPQGFLYVTVNDSLPLDWFGGAGMYILSDLEPMPWKPHRMVEREYIDSDGDLHILYEEAYFSDENGEEIVCYESHFKAAGIENERRYFLRLLDEDGFDRGMIPAVRRGEQYLDLVDGALIDYQPGMRSETYATALVGSIPKPDFNL